MVLVNVRGVHLRRTKDVLEVRLGQIEDPIRHEQPVLQASYHFVQLLAAERIA